MNHVLAIDPGGVTGLALTQPVACRFLTWTETNPVGVIDSLKTYAVESEGRAVVVEQFATAQRLNKHSRYTIELIGGIRAVCWVFGLRFVLQAPRARLDFLAQARTILEASERKWVVHEQDALAHLLAFEAKNGVL